MKVLQINSFFTVGGPPRIVNGIYDTLIEEGHECKIAAAREKMYKPEDSVQIGTSKSVNLNAIKARVFDNEGFNAEHATKKLIKWIKDYDPDVIHLHNLHGYYLNIELLFDYLKTVEKPVIWTLHDCWAFTGHSAYCDAIDCKRWKDGCFKCPQIREYPKAYIDRSKENWENKRRILCGVKNLTIVTPSQWLADLVKESFLCEYPVRVIHNGIDLKQFKPLKNDFRNIYKLENKYIVLGIASLWSNFKGLADYVKLSSMLGEDYKIVLVGLSDDQIKELPKNILGLSRTHSIKELSCIYSSADVFLNLTYCDTFPTVNIESIACGTPVITYKTGGSSEVINNANGYVVEKGDIQSVKLLLENIRNKDWNREHISSQAVQYDRQTVTDQYISVYGLNDIDRGGVLLKRIDAGCLNKIIILGVAAVWDTRKGVHDFLKLSEMLSDDYKIVMIGLNDDQISSMPDSILKIKKTNSVKELAEWYSMADFFVNTTYQDNYPTVNLEAQACGTQVITYRTGGSPESVPEDNVVEVGDIQSLINRIKELSSQRKVIPLTNVQLADRTLLYQSYIELYKGGVINKSFGYWKRGFNNVVHTYVEEVWAT